MTNHSHALADLFACFRGSLPEQADWMSLLGLSNQTLTTPALMEVTDRFGERIPEDVRIYIREMFNRNVIRNDRLAVQLAETVQAINDRGVTPVLLKGAAMLATAPRSRWGSKLMSDLDIMVQPEEVDATLDALFAVGYSVDVQTPPDDNKWFTDLKRPDDVGMVDLHRELPGPAFFYRPSGDWKQHCELKQVGQGKQGKAYIPSATYQALILTIHDQFQDSDYWTGNIDVRHLLDLRDLARSAEGIDWNALVSFTPNRLARNGLETQLVALSALLDVDVPARLRSRFIPRVQFRRRLIQARFPLLRQLLLPIAFLDYRNYRAGLGPSRARGTNAGRRRWALPRRETLRFLFSLSRENRNGKV